MQPGQKRPAIDTLKVKQMLQMREHSAEIRYVADREANGGGASLFLLNEFKQEYIVMHFKHPIGPPTPFCRLCKCETWSHSHILSNKHLDKLAMGPYKWRRQWHDAPTYTETGIDDPQSGNEGITFPVIHAEYVKKLACEGKDACSQRRRCASF